WADGDLSARFPGGESGHEVARRYGEQLRAIADEHRGETGLVVGHESAACSALPVLASGLQPPYDDRMRTLGHGETVELMMDADGCVLNRWGERMGVHSRHEIA